MFVALGRAMSFFALSGHADRSAECPLLEVKRTRLVAAHMSAKTQNGHANHVSRPSAQRISIAIVRPSVSRVC